MNSDLGGYIPCFNNAATLAAAIESVLMQNVPLTDLVVIDDASNDESVEIAQRLGVRCIRMGENSGRGAVRARAFEELQTEFVLGLDATNALAPGFIENAMPLFAEPTIAFVRGELRHEEPKKLADRWRARHLFQQWRSGECQTPYKTSLATGGCIARRSAVLGLGNFNPELRHSEDLELGERLRRANLEVVAQPASQLRPLTGNSISEVLERYWRWYAGVGEPIDLVAYLRTIWYALVVLARRDIEARDWACVPLSLFVPHYQFWRSMVRRLALACRTNAIERT